MSNQTQKSVASTITAAVVDQVAFVDYWTLEYGALAGADTQRSPIEAAWYAALAWERSQRSHRAILNPQSSAHRSLRPLGGRVIAVQCSKYEPPPGLIIPAESARKKGTKYRVIATCPSNTMVRPDDIILVDEYSGTEIEIDGITHKIFTPHDIIAKWFEERSACALSSPS